MLPGICRHIDNPNIEPFPMNQWRLDPIDLLLLCQQLIQAEPAHILPEHQLGAGIELARGPVHHLHQPLRVRDAVAAHHIQPHPHLIGGQNLLTGDIQLLDRSEFKIELPLNGGTLGG